MDSLEKHLKKSHNFRKINFAQLLFTADSLADTENYDVRDWGSESHSTSLDIGSQVLIQM